MISEISTSGNFSGSRFHSFGAVCKKTLKSYLFLYLVSCSFKGFNKKYEVKYQARRDISQLELCDLLTLITL